MNIARSIRRRPLLVAIAATLTVAAIASASTSRAASGTSAGGPGAAATVHGSAGGPGGADTVHASAGAPGGAPTGAVTAETGTQPSAPRQVVVPAGVTAGIAVFDRQAGWFTVRQNADARFRSASVVKLLIVLDYLWDRGPGYAIPATDRARLDVMLRSSDDAAASYYWQRDGYEQVVSRMVTRLGLRDTAPPPASQRGYWGYTALSAADTVRIYRYILDTAPVPVREYVMGNLRQSTRCGTDGFDQSFGIPSAFRKPWAVKQGWSGFASVVAPACTTQPVGTTQPGGAMYRASGTRPASGSRLVAAGLDLVSEALHTTGTAGENDRSIVAVFTLHPDGTRAADAAAALTQLTRSLPVPGAVPAGTTPPPSGVWFGTWGSGVLVRAEATSASPVLASLPAGAEVLVGCQKRGQEVVAESYRNDWWAYLPEYHGYLTNIYISSPDNKLPNVPEC